MPSVSSSLRLGLLMEFDYLCHYCGVDYPSTLDHIVPISAGGPSARWNLVPACPECNMLKSSFRAVCPCDRCIRAEVMFEALGIAPPVRRPRQRRRDGLPTSVVVVPSSIEEWRLLRMAHCNHVAIDDEIYCVKCGAVIAQRWLGKPG